MSTATVTVKYVNQSNGFKANGQPRDGTIKVQDDSLYGVAPGMLPQFQPGGTYEIEFTSREWQGKTFRSVQKAKKVGDAPTPQGGGYAQNNKETQLHIFVCGALNHAIGAGKIDVLDEESCLMAVETLKRVWRQAFDGKEGEAKKTASEDMNDSIPF